jgi:hypothetical protein
LSKENFNWNGFLLSTSNTVNEIAEKLEKLPNYISAYKSKNHIPLSLKRKLDNIYGREFVNQFIIL